MQSFFRKPMLFSRGLNQELSYLGVSGLVALVFLYVVRPFGFANLNDQLLLGFGIVSIATGVVYIIIGHLVHRRFFSDRNWTVGSEIVYSLIFLLCIASAIQLYGDYMQVMPLNPLNFFLSLFYTVVIGVIPVSIRAMLLRNWRLKRELAEVHAINNHLQNQKLLSDQKIIRFPLSRNDSLDIMNHDLLYIESSENYLTIAWTKDAELKKQLIRMTMKEAIGLISDPFIAPCHRSYIVNLRKATRINYSNGKATILLTDLQTEIPVSDTYKKRVRQQLAGVQK